MPAKNPESTMSPIAALVAALGFSVLSTFSLAQSPSNGSWMDNRIDVVLPNAPEMAKFGDYAIGVRTLTVVNQDRPDVVNTENGGATARYDRPLTLEFWYPAQLAEGQVPGGEYRAITRNPAITATLKGSGVRDAAPLNQGRAFPLVIISHGYPGNRFLMSHLGESLASKGYVAVSIDHKDSTYDDQEAFGSTLYNRPLDQRFVLQSIADMALSADHFLFGLVDVNRTGVVGYSMGGYGLVNNLGGGYNDAMVTADLAPPNSLLGEHASGNPEFRSNLDSRIKVGFAVAPWGKNVNLWSAADLAGVTVPTFYLAGDNDNVAGYGNGVRAIYEEAVNSDRYLLTFAGAGHNAGAPIALPVEIRDNEDQTGATHYTDENWDNFLMNNIMDHFATALFDYYLKDNQRALDYLQGPISGDWHGFPAGGEKGLTLEHQARR